MKCALPLLAVGLAACQPLAPLYPPITGPPAATGAYRAIGTEPFWDLTIGRNLVFTDRGNNVSVAEPTPPARRGVAGESYFGRRLRVDIVHGRCSDGMSERIYPDSVYATVDGRFYRGCGATSAFFARVGEDGRDRQQAEPDLAIRFVGRWIAASFDGRPAAPDDRFALVVTPTMVRTEGVCNDLRGHYLIVERRLTPNGMMWPRSERGCDPDRMTLEDRIFAVMWHTPVISFPAPDRLRLASARGSIEFERKR